MIALSILEALFYRTLLHPYFSTRPSTNSCANSPIESSNKFNYVLSFSGGEDSRIIVTSLQNGNVLMKFDHHRGPVNSIRVDSAGEILVSGSSDCTVCLWCLKKFTMLKNIVLPSPVTMLDVSADSVFLLAACEDQKLYLRSLATGTEIHTLRGHQGEVKSVCLARDCRRAIVGGTKGKVSVFDMHSGRLTRTLTTYPSADVTAVKVSNMLLNQYMCSTFLNFE